VTLSFYFLKKKAIFKNLGSEGRQGGREVTVVSSRFKVFPKRDRDRGGKKQQRKRSAGERERKGGIIRYLRAHIVLV